MLMSPGGASASRPSRVRGTAVVALFATTLGLSAFLLFAVQPLVGKMLLPSLGGTPMVWNTCVLFFQLLLLGGYLYAHIAPAWLGPRRHALTYLVLLALPFAVLPFSTTVTGPPPDTPPVGWLFLALMGVIGLPFFVLSTSAVIVQQWFSRLAHPLARDPYFLYAASNGGSLLALISYPSVVEPTWRLRDQSQLWAIGYLAFVIAASACIAVLWRSESRHEDAAPAFADHDRPARPSGRQRVRWVALAAIPSSLMLALTSYLTTDIAAVPLLWVVPLSLYLLTFVLAFGSSASWARTLADRGLPLLVLPLVLLMVAGALAALWLVVPLHLLTFTTAAVLCHLALASDRPASSSLTEFYFWIALGGVLGGAFNTLLAPIMFSGIVEYPLVLVLVCLFRTGRSSGRGGAQRPAIDTVVAIAIGALTAGLMLGVRRLGAEPRLTVAALALPAILSFSQSRRPVRFALSLGAMLLAGGWIGNTSEATLYRERTFFGVYRVKIDPSGRYRILSHGTTLHGMQAIDRTRSHEPLAYFHRTGPFGQAFDRLRLSRAPQIAVVGLGVGSLASYAEPGQRWTFYELDPAVERLARTSGYFTYLRDCGNRCRVVLGDARLALTGAPQNEYGLIVLDAFSSDAIPTHLLTSEALTLYVSRLATGGVLAFHISNRHLALGPVLARLARDHGLAALEQQDLQGAEVSSTGKSPSHWLLMARQRADLGPLLTAARWSPPIVPRSTPRWTDDASSILAVLRLR